MRSGNVRVFAALCASRPQSRAWSHAVFFVYFVTFVNFVVKAVFSAVFAVSALKTVGAIAA
jgi:hypothetical protein